MAYPRPSFSLTLASVVVVILFSGQQGATSARFSPRSPFFFEDKEAALLRKEDSTLRRLKAEYSGRLSADRQVKRSRGEELGTDLVQFFSEEQVDEATKQEYKTIPAPMISTTKVLQKGVSCSTLHSDLHENHVKPELRLRPEWIYESELIGDCPTHYVTRELPAMYSPSTMLEAVCACGGSQCSEDGHQCVPVSRHVPVWVRRGPNLHVLDVEEITVACACARRPSAGGNFIYNAAIQS